MCHHTYLNLELVLNKRERHRLEPPSQLLGELALEEECCVVSGLRELYLYTAALLADIILKRRDANRVRASCYRGGAYGRGSCGSHPDRSSRSLRWCGAAHHFAFPISVQELNKTVCEEMGLSVRHHSSWVMGCHLMWFADPKVNYSV